MGVWPHLRPAGPAGGGGHRQCVHAEEERLSVGMEELMLTKVGCVCLFPQCSIYHSWKTLTGKFREGKMKCRQKFITLK